LTETDPHGSAARDTDLDARELVPPPPLSVKEIASLFLRTWPHLKPVAWHVVGWFVLAMVIGLTTGYVAITGVDLFTNAVLNGQPIAPLQSIVLLLDPSYVDATALTADQRTTILIRLILYGVAFTIVFRFRHVVLTGIGVGFVGGALGGALSIYVMLSVGTSVIGGIMTPGDYYALMDLAGTIGGLVRDTRILILDTDGGPRPADGERARQRPAPGRRGTTGDRHRAPPVHHPASGPDRVPAGRRYSRSGHPRRHDGRSRRCLSSLRRTPRGRCRARVARAYSGEQHLDQSNAAQAPRNGAFDLPKVRHLTGDMDLKFVGPTAPVLFKTRPVIGLETCGVKVSVFRLGSENCGCVERIATRVLDCSLADDGPQFIHGARPTNAPSLVPQGHWFARTRFEV